VVLGLQFLLILENHLSLIAYMDISQCKILFDIKILCFIFSYCSCCSSYFQFCYEPIIKVKRRSRRWVIIYSKHSIIEVIVTIIGLTYLLSIICKDLNVFTIPLAISFSSRLNSILKESSIIIIIHKLWTLNVSHFPIVPTSVNNDTKIFYCYEICNS
jgi:hypothetical protein